MSNRDVSECVGNVGDSFLFGFAHVIVSFVLDNRVNNKQALDSAVFHINDSGFTQYE